MIVSEHLKFEFLLGSEVQYKRRHMFEELKPQTSSFILWHHPMKMFALKMPWPHFRFTVVSHVRLTQLGSALLLVSARSVPIGTKSVPDHYGACVN